MSTPKSKENNLTVADLDLQEAPPESQLPDTPEPPTKGHKDSSSTTTKSNKSNLTVADLDVQQAPPESQLPDTPEPNTKEHEDSSSPTVSSPKPNKSKLTVADLDVQQAPPESQLPDTLSKPSTKEHKDSSSPTVSPSKSDKSKLTVADLDLQQAPPDSQLPDTPEPHSKAHKDSSTPTVSSSKSSKSSLTVADLDLQQAPPESQLPDAPEPSMKELPAVPSPKANKSNVTVADLDLQEAPPESQLPDVPEPYTKEHKDPNDNAIDTDAAKNPIQPLPWRNGEGSNILGPRNYSRERQASDMVRPPSTDHGTMANMKWSFADSHTRIEEGGWARQTTVRELPTSVQLAGVNMRLDEGAIRELHWHKEGEWAYILEGRVRVTALDKEGGNYIDEVGKGDLWYFPSGHPHSLQGLSPGGCEFLLIFDSGDFSEDSTFLLTDLFSHIPRSVLAKNFRLDPEIFGLVPQKERYIFEGSPPEPLPHKEGIKKSKLRFTHKMLAQKPEVTSAGDVRITDTSNFPLSTTVSAAHVTIKPGAIRELHWHPNADEWSYFIRGHARVTIFASSSTARTFNYAAGDVGVVPVNMAHYVENVSETEELEMLEIFKAPKFEDFSLEQWLSSTPETMVAEHLFRENPRAGRKFVEELRAVKEVVKPKL